MTFSGFPRRGGMPILLTCLAGALLGCGSQDNPTSTTSGAVATTAQPTPGQTPTGPEANVSGDIPDTQAFVAYTLPSAAVSIQVPEGWARSESGGAVTFTSHFNSVQVSTMPAAGAPTVASAQSTEAAAIMRQGTNVALGAVSSVARKAGQAILITYKADSPADPVTGHYARLDVERYEFWRSGTEVVLTLSSPVGSDNVDPWRKITDSFQWL